MPLKIFLKFDFDVAVENRNLGKPYETEVFWIDAPFPIVYTLDYKK